MRQVIMILAAYGDIAQLGERLNGIQEVVGSIPIISTKFKALNLFQGFFVFACYVQNSVKINRTFIVKKCG
ncbi:unknown [[Mannheimia] succiniciproducens MBEL55E]|uniref:Uncharacterized protein n=1 Tax=Mannheimia succiniciproducens (strain KCTC 0769BP / MBEL55E) TaxID=221988 RepID=Q65VB2_MANSM|nr:unknown [[Mannheimia] succiniciproducens MBEL55E]